MARPRTEQIECPNGRARRVITLTLDRVQSEWLDAIAELHGCGPENVLREALRRLSAAESARVARTKRYAAIALACRAERFDPISDYLAGIEPELP